MAAEKTRDRHRSTGTIALGWSSIQTKTTMLASASAATNQTARAGIVGHEVSTYVAVPSATTPVRAPRQSKWRGASSSRDSGIREPSSSTMAQSGRLIAKIHRQPPCSSR